jgi:hypothetical protein
MTKRQYNFGSKYNGYAGWPHIHGGLQRFLQVFQMPARIVASWPARIAEADRIAKRMENKN